jgi:hypothetical protein
MVNSADVESAVGKEVVQDVSSAGRAEPIECLAFFVRLLIRHIRLCNDAASEQFTPSVTDRTHRELAYLYSTT